MRKVIAYLLVLALVGAVYAQKKKWYEEKLVSVRYDRFKDSTALNLDLKNASLIRKWRREYEKRPCLHPHISFEGKVPKDQSPLVTVGFFSISKDWKFLRGHDLYALVDSKPMEMPKTKREGGIIGGFVSETIFFKLSWEDFCKLCDAQVVEFQLGLEEFKVGEPEFALLRQFRQVYLDLLEEK